MLPIPRSPRLAPALFLLARRRCLPLLHTRGYRLGLAQHSSFLGLNHEALNYETRNYEIMPAVGVLNEPFRPHFFAI